jgi:hypothetical protein
LASALDPVGNVALVLQVTILFMLILGLPFVKSEGSKKNLMRHGYLTTLAVALHTVLIFVVMVPSFVNGFNGLAGQSIEDLLNVWSHVVLGTVAEALGVLLIVAWLHRPPSTLACSRWKKWMMPTFVIWVISLVGGTLIHILGMM